MQIIKDYLREKGIYPKIDFDDKLVHTVEVLKAKVVEYEDGSDMLKLLVRENKELKVITTPSVLLELQECQEGERYNIQLKYKKIGNRPIRTYEVSKIEVEKGQI